MASAFQGKGSTLLNTGEIESTPPMSIFHSYTGHYSQLTYFLDLMKKDILQLEYVRVSKEIPVGTLVLILPLLSRQCKHGDCKKSAERLAQPRQA